MKFHQADGLESAEHRAQSRGQWTLARHALHISRQCRVEESSTTRDSFWLFFFFFCAAEVQTQFKAFSITSKTSVVCDGFWASAGFLTFTVVGYLKNKINNWRSPIYWIQTQCCCLPLLRFGEKPKRCLIFSSWWMWARWENVLWSC